MTQDRYIVVTPTKQLGTEFLEHIKAFNRCSNASEDIKGVYRIDKQRKTFRGLNISASCFNTYKDEIYSESVALQLKVAELYPEYKYIV